MMNLLLACTALSALNHAAEAFLPAATSRTATLSSTPSSINGRCSSSRSSSSTRLHGINEWRDQALEAKYTLGSYEPTNNDSPSATSQSSIPATLPILPFPFTDILLQGQRTQLNLYEQRFHTLFSDAMENHCGMVGMGLLAGNGMITTLPLCEVESFTRFGAEDDWVDRGDGLGNGSIFVTIRAVGRVRIVESELIQEEPYMMARVAEVLDEDASMEEGTGTSGLKEKKSGNVSGESTSFEIACLVAGNIENLTVNLASMEHKLKAMEEGAAEDYMASGGAEGKAEDGDEAMNRRMVNAQLESLFMQDSSEGVDMENSDKTEIIDDDDDDDEEEVEEEDDELAEDETNETMDRVAQFEEAFASAKEADTFGYVMPPTNTIDLPQSTKSINDLSERNNRQQSRTPKDLAAMSWAAFCTGDANNIQRDVMKIQALDMVNVLQRLQLAAAMLREEKKKCKAKLALAGIKDDDVDGDEEES